MTTITSESVAVTSLDKRHSSNIWNVVRLNLVNKWSTMGLPIVVLGAILAINYAIWWIVFLSTPPAGRAVALSHTSYSGGEFYIYIFMLILGIQVVAMTFPFALGFSVTRRDFYLGSSLTFGILAAGYAVLLTLLSYIEQWTNGWGLGGHLFTSIYFGAGSGTAWPRLFIAFVGLLFCLYVGAASATIFMRWRMNGLVVAGTAFAVLIVGAVALISFTDNWFNVWTWFGASGPTVIVAWLLVPTAIAAIAGYFVLQRATPKS